MSFRSELMKEVREVLNKVRAYKGVTASQLARLAGGAADGVDAQLTGRVAMTQGRAEELARALGLDWSDVSAVAKQRWQHNEQYEAALRRMSQGG